MSVNRTTLNTCASKKHVPIKQKGITLIEVLISVFVLAIGILGMAGLQLNAKQTNFEALQRSTASALVQNMLERMRANPSALDSYVPEPASAPSADCTTAPCSASDLAVWDRWEWKQLLAGSSESGRGGLLDPASCITNVSGDVSVTVYWTGISEIEHLASNSCAGYAAGDVSKVRVFEVGVFISE